MKAELGGAIGNSSELGQMDLNLTGAVTANLNLVQPAKTDYSALISAGSVLLGVVISQFFEWLKRRGDDRKEAKKRFFELKRESYSQMIEGIAEYITAGEKSEESDEKDRAFLKLRLGAYKVQLAGNEKVQSLITENWMKLGDSDFIEKELIPALNEDIQGILIEQKKIPRWSRFLESVKSQLKT